MSDLFPYDLKPIQPAVPRSGIVDNVSVLTMPLSYMPTGEWDLIFIHLYWELLRCSHVITT